MESELFYLWRSYTYNNTNSVSSMVSKEYALKQISLISLKYGIFLASCHWILSTTSYYENFPFLKIKKNISLYILRLTPMRHRHLSIDKENGNVKRSRKDFVNVPGVVSVTKCVFLSANYELNQVLICFSNDE